MMKRILVLASALALLVLSCTSTTTAPLADVSEDDELNYNYIWLQRIYWQASELSPIESYIGKGDTITYGDVKAMYESLSDDFTRYFTPLEAKATLQMYMGDDSEVAHMGIMQYLRNASDSTVADTFEIANIAPNSPAAKAGVRKHDLVLKVNGKDVTGKNAIQFPTYTNGAAGTILKLTLLRDSKTVDISVIKQNFDMPSVWTDTVDQIPVIQVSSFDARNAGKKLIGTAAEFKEALDKMGSFKVAIIDLRNNPGGSVDQCTQMTDMLLDTGIIVYQIEHRWDAEKQKSVIDTTQPLVVHKGTTNYEDREYVFLANKGSASCSEIMLAGVQYSTNWPIVGTKSYGKGIGQEVGNSLAGGLMVITTTEFRDGNMENYHGHDNGIAHSIPVSNPDSILSAGVLAAKSILDTLGDGAQKTLTRRGAHTVLDREALRRIDGMLEGRPQRPNGAFQFK